MTFSVNFISSLLSKFDMEPSKIEHNCRKHKACMNKSCSQNFIFLNKKVDHKTKASIALHESLPKSKIRHIRYLFTL